MWKILLCVLAVPCIFEFCEVEALKVGDEGVCIVKSSLRRTRNRIVTYQKWCGRKKCIHRGPKPEVYYVSTNQTVCCEGWHYKAEADACTPLCSTGCIGGRCIAPNVCHCDPPAYLDPEHQNICISPTCAPQCVNADCTSNNTCHCKTNFSSFNSTHCFQCDAGYTIDSNFVCAPICSKKCVNGNCTAPNVCTCLKGFKSSNTSEDICEPVCSKCINGQCTAPDTCTCLNGYSRVNSTYCAPKCDKCDGVCISPDVCKCSEGFAKVDGKCTPICNISCANGVCTAPNTCTCYDSYVKKAPDVCYKPCGSACNGTCVKGECVEKDCKLTQLVPKTKWVHGKRMNYKAKVEKRACCQGWYFNRKEKTCKAVCDMDCKNGRCVAPNDCRCDPPYILKDQACVIPTCKDSCVNAKCVDTDVCACNPDFERVNSTHCAPNCTTGLINDPHTLNCTCNSGYEFDPENETKCLPICELKCVNANCIAPNTCSCLPGHEYAGNNYTCRPKCDDCDNGVCLEPNVCKCNNGYTKNSVGKCVPFCSKSCTNGHCHKPETCGCDSGYKLDNEDKYTCMPVCKIECVNGTCVSPNKCSCLSGYEKVNNTVCRPKCSSCDHGECIAPGECRCRKGYIMSGGICSPYCQDFCVNGDCVAPDSCGCHPGYIKNSTVSYICYKPCRGPCRNGVCNLIGECICDRGYALEGDNCESIVPVECATCNGSCSDESCWCLTGMPCFITNPESAEVATTATLAGLELSWVLAGTIVIVLVVLAVVVMQRMWKRNRKTYEHKPPRHYDHSSVLYTVPDTLKRIDTNNKDKYTYDYNKKNEDTKSEYENITEEQEVSEQLFAGQDNVYRPNDV